jgi:hypothetical protein
MMGCLSDPSKTSPGTVSSLPKTSTLKNTRHGLLKFEVNFAEMDGLNKLPNKT